MYQDITNSFWYRKWQKKNVEKKKKYMNKQNWYLGVLWKDTRSSSYTSGSVILMRIASFLDACLKKVIMKGCHLLSVILGCLATIIISTTSM
jgi:hypothetical protein